jgi:hypothetical protein
MFELLNKLDPLVFFIALTLGILYTYLTHKEPTVIIKYPSSKESPVYKEKDNENKCYKYSSEDVRCPTNLKDIVEIPK